MATTAAFQLRVASSPPQLPNLSVTEKELSETLWNYIRRNRCGYRSRLSDLSGYVCALV